jgi:hypothetical protein
VLFEIVEIAAILNGKPLGKMIQCFKSGWIYIATSKVLIFGRGKVEFPEAQELIELKAERKANQSVFSKNIEKQERLKDLDRKMYNYERSQGNLKAFLAAGFKADSTEDAHKIVTHLIEEVEKMGIDLTVGVKSTVVSRLEGPKDRLKIVSRWQVKEGLNGERLIYLDTLTFEAK